MIETTSLITWPNCGHERVETMPDEACQHFYR